MSDHISGPRAIADPVIDITDVYAFPCPEIPRASRPGNERLSLRWPVRAVFRCCYLQIARALCIHCA